MLDTMIYICNLGIYWYICRISCSTTRCTDEVNTWLWSFGRGKSRLGGLSIEQTAARQDAAVSEAQRKLAAKPKRVRKTAPGWFEVKGGISLYIAWCAWYIPLYTVICRDYLIYFQHTCFFHFWLQDRLCCAWRMNAGMINHQHTALHQEITDLSLYMWKHEIYHDAHGIYWYELSTHKSKMSIQFFQFWRQITPAM